MKIATQKWVGLVILLAVITGCSGSEEKGEKTAAQYVLAFSWQPAFCETAMRKRECKTQDEHRYDATNFSLHGLWPQPGSNIYCGVEDDEISKDKKRKWHDLASPRISDNVWRDLKRVMPGIQSNLHKHEWVKHGVCSPADIDEYYAQSIWVLETINGSKLRELFVDNIGRQLSGNTIRKTFEESFGKGAGDRLRISCKRDRDTDRQMIIEMTIGLANPFEKDASLSTLIAAAPQTDPGCPTGIVDPVGFQ